MDLLDRLLDHDHWATTHLWEACRPLTDDQFDQEFDIGHRTLRATIFHLISNIDFWTDVMTGARRDHPQDTGSIEALIAHYESTWATFAALARQKRDDHQIDDTFIDAYGETLSYGGAILHVLLHNEGHRTEILHILQRLGLPEIEVDHALWDLAIRLPNTQ